MLCQWSAAFTNIMQIGEEYLFSKYIVPINIYYCADPARSCRLSYSIHVLGFKFFNVACYLCNLYGINL